jgi:hypothetical protein
MIEKLQQPWNVAMTAAEPLRRVMNSRRCIVLAFIQ